MATYTSNYAWTKPSGGDPVDIEVLNDNLDDQDSIVHQAFLDLAPVFSTANTYAVKDVVLYDNKVWICHTAVTTAGAWTGSTNWAQTTVGETGGVATYADLPDKPSINGNELSGDKTGAQLGLQNTLTFDNVPTANSTNPVKSGGVYSADEAIRQWTTAEAKSVSGNPITLTDGSARKAEGLVVTLEPKQSGSGTPSPTNVRPITGYTECVVDRDGKNFFDKDNTESGYIDGSGNIVPSATWSHEFIKVNGNTQYTISGCFVNDTPKHCWFDKDMNFISAFSSHTNGTFTSPQNASYMGICAIVMTNPSHDLDTIQVEEGNTATPYVPYSHYNVILAFGQTVYGAIVNPKTGEGDVIDGFTELDGSSDEEWTTRTTGSGWTLFEILVNNCRDFSSATKVGLCNEFRWDNDLASDNEYRIQSSKLAIRKDGLTLEQFKTWLASNHLQISYPLATPTELTLTPAELELLKGYNYITTNGTTIALDYLPDSLLAEAENYVDAKIPPAPSSDGTYVLTCTVTSGTPAYSWESAT